MTDELEFRERKIDFLRQLPLFARLSEAALGTLNIISKEYAFERGAIIAYEGDVADNLYIVREGQLEAFILDGNERYVRKDVYSAGDYFDDQWLFEPSTHPATVRARRPGRMIVVPTEVFLNFLKAQPAVVRAIYPQLSLLAQDEINRSRFRGYLEQSQRRRVAQPSAQVQVQEQTQTTATEENEPFGSSKKRIQTYARLDLLPEEVVYFEARRSWKIISAQALLYGVSAAVLLLIPVILLGTSGISGTISLVVGGAMAGYPLFRLFITWLNWLNCYFFVTNKRIIRYENRPLKFDKNNTKIDIENVQSVNIETPSLITRWLDIGTAIITTAAQTGTVYFDFIDQPQNVEKALDFIRQRNEAIGQGQRREALRRSVEQYFDVDQKIKILPPEIEEAVQNRQGMFGGGRPKKKQTGRAANGVISYHKHPVALFRPILLPVTFGIALLLIYTVLYFLFADLLLIPAVFGFLVIFALADLAWLIWVVEDWRNDTYQLTDRYIFDIDRLPLGLRESRKQAELANIENVNVEQTGFLPSMLNFGNVSVETAGVESNIVFENVREPNQIQKEIFLRRDQFRARLKKVDQERQREDYALLIDLYYQAVQNGRIVREPLPEIDIDDELEEDEEERPLEL